MNRSTQISLCDRIFSHLDHRTTDTAEQLSRIPTDVYTSTELLTREKENLFRQLPQFVGLSCLLPQPGDYLCDDHYGLPLLFVRDNDGRFRTFLNVCQHRGSRVANGKGNIGRKGSVGTLNPGSTSKRAIFVCPYHGWSYDTKGKLAGIPSAEHFDGLNTAHCGLRELDCVESDGMLWIFLQARKTAEIQSYLGGLSDDLRNYGLGDYHHYQDRRLSLDMNWKLVIDTFLEPYHFPVLHKNTVGPIFFPNLCLFDAFGPHLREVLPRRSINGIRDTARSQWDLITHSAVVYVLFPNTVLVMQVDHIETWRSFPDWNDPNRSHVILDFYIPEPATTEKAIQHWDANMELTIQTVLEEDFPVSAGAQFGFHSDGQSHLVLGRNEPALAHFEQTVMQHLE